MPAPPALPAVLPPAAAPPAEPADPSDDSAVACDVCGIGAFDDDNLIVICSLCDVAVHQGCYSVHDVPAGNWYCKACTCLINDAAAAADASPYVRLPCCLVCQPESRLVFAHDDLLATTAAAAGARTSQAVRAAVSAGEGYCYAPRAPTAALPIPVAPARPDLPASYYDKVSGSWSAPSANANAAASSAADAGGSSGRKPSSRRSKPDSSCAAAAAGDALHPLPAPSPTYVYPTRPSPFAPVPCLPQLYSCFPAPAPADAAAAAALAAAMTGPTSSSSSSSASASAGEGSIRVKLEKPSAAAAASNNNDDDNDDNGDDEANSHESESLLLRPPPRWGQVVGALTTVDPADLAALAVAAKVRARPRPPGAGEAPAVTLLKAATGEVLAKAADAAARPAGKLGPDAEWRLVPAPPRPPSLYCVAAATGAAAIVGPAAAATGVEVSPGPRFYCHVSCADWLPNLSFADDDADVGVRGLGASETGRYNLVCTVCKQKGMCLQCSLGSCKVAFHAHCAVKGGLELSFKQVQPHGAKLNGSGDYVVEKRIIRCAAHRDDKVDYFVTPRHREFWKNIANAPALHQPPMVADDASAVYHNNNTNQKNSNIKTDKDNHGNSKNSSSKKLDSKPSAAATAAGLGPSPALMGTVGNATISPSDASAFPASAPAASAPAQSAASASASASSDADASAPVRRVTRFTPPQSPSLTAPRTAPRTVPRTVAPSPPRESASVAARMKDSDDDDNDDDDDGEDKAVKTENASTANVTADGDGAIPGNAESEGEVWSEISDNYDDYDDDLYCFPPICDNYTSRKLTFAPVLTNNSSSSSGGGGGANARARGMSQKLRIRLTPGLRFSSPFAYGLVDRPEEQLPTLELDSALALVSAGSAAPVKKKGAASGAAKGAQGKAGAGLRGAAKSDSDDDASDGGAAEDGGRRKRVIKSKYGGVAGSFGGFDDDEEWEKIMAHGSNIYDDGLSDDAEEEDGWGGSGSKGKGKKGSSKKASGNASGKNKTFFGVNATAGKSGGNSISDLYASVSSLPSGGRGGSSSLSALAAVSDDNVSVAQSLRALASFLPVPGTAAAASAGAGAAAAAETAAAASAGCGKLIDLLNATADAAATDALNAAICVDVNNAAAAELALSHINSNGHGPSGSPTASLHLNPAALSLASSAAHPLSPLAFSPTPSLSLAALASGGAGSGPGGEVTADDAAALGVELADWALQAPALRRVFVKEVLAAARNRSKYLPGFAHLRQDDKASTMSLDNAENAGTSKSAASNSKNAASAASQQINGNKSDAASAFEWYGSDVKSAGEFIARVNTEYFADNIALNISDKTVTVTPVELLQCIARDGGLTASFTCDEQPLNEESLLSVNSNSKSKTVSATMTVELVTKSDSKMTQKNKKGAETEEKHATVSANEWPLETTLLPLTTATAAKSNGNEVTAGDNKNTAPALLLTRIAPSMSDDASAQTAADGKARALFALRLQPATVSALAADAATSTDAASASVHASSMRHAGVAMSDNADDTDISNRTSDSSVISRLRGETAFVTAGGASAFEIPLSSAHAASMAAALALESDTLQQPPAPFSYTRVSVMPDGAAVPEIYSKHYNNCDNSNSSSLNANSSVNHTGAVVDSAAVAFGQVNFPPVQAVSDVSTLIPRASPCEEKSPSATPLLTVTLGHVDAKAAAAATAAAAAAAAAAASASKKGGICNQNKASSGRFSRAPNTHTAPVVPEVDDNSGDSKRLEYQQRMSSLYSQTAGFYSPLGADNGPNVVVADTSLLLLNKQQQQEQQKQCEAPVGAGLNSALTLHLQTASVAQLPSGDSAPSAVKQVAVTVTAGDWCLRAVHLLKKPPTMFPGSDAAGDAAEAGAPGTPSQRSKSRQSGRTAAKLGASDDSAAPVGAAHVLTELHTAYALLRAVQVENARLASIALANANAAPAKDVVKVEHVAPVPQQKQSPQQRSDALIALLARYRAWRQRVSVALLRIERLEARARRRDRAVAKAGAVAWQAFVPTPSSNVISKDSATADDAESKHEESAPISVVAKDVIAMADETKDASLSSNKAAGDGDVIAIDTTTATTSTLNATAESAFSYDVGNDSSLLQWLPPLKSVKCDANALCSVCGLLDDDDDDDEDEAGENQSDASDTDADSIADPNTADSQHDSDNGDSSVVNRGKSASLPTMVQCMGCLVTVHPRCYGDNLNLFSPLQQILARQQQQEQNTSFPWLCARCVMSSLELHKACVVCGLTSGAMRPIELTREPCSSAAAKPVLTAAAAWVVRYHSTLQDVLKQAVDKIKEKRQQQYKAAVRAAKTAAPTAETEAKQPVAMTDNDENIIGNTDSSAADSTSVDTAALNEILTAPPTAAESASIEAAVRVAAAEFRPSPIQWAHLSCSLWVPEMYFRAADFCEPVASDAVSSLPAKRRALPCYICNDRERGGAAVQCMEKKCFASFHVHCARTRGQAELCLHTDQHTGDSAYVSYCRKHRNDLVAPNALSPAGVANRGPGPAEPFTLEDRAASHGLPTTSPTLALRLPTAVIRGHYTGHMGDENVRTRLAPSMAEAAAAAAKQRLLEVHQENVLLEWQQQQQGGISGPAGGKNTGKQPLGAAAAAAAAVVAGGARAEVPLWRLLGLSSPMDNANASAAHPVAAQHPWACFVRTTLSGLAVGIARPFLRLQQQQSGSPTLPQFALPFLLSLPTHVRWLLLPPALRASMRRLRSAAVWARGATVLGQDVWPQLQWARSALQQQQRNKTDGGRQKPVVLRLPFTPCHAAAVSGVAVDSLSGDGGETVVCRDGRCNGSCIQSPEAVAAGAATVAEVLRCSCCWGGGVTVGTLFSTLLGLNTPFVPTYTETTLTDTTNSTDAVSKPDAPTADPSFSGATASNSPFVIAALPSQTESPWWLRFFAELVRGSIPLERETYWLNGLDAAAKAASSKPASARDPQGGSAAAAVAVLAHRIPVPDLLLEPASGPVTASGATLHMPRLTRLALSNEFDAVCSAWKRLPVLPSFNPTVAGSEAYGTGIGGWMGSSTIGLGVVPSPGAASPSAMSDAVGENEKVMVFSASASSSASRIVDADATVSAVGSTNSTNPASSLAMGSCSGPVSTQSLRQQLLSLIAADFAFTHP